MCLQDDWNDKKCIKVPHLQKKIPSSCEGPDHLFPREGALQQINFIKISCLRLI